MIAVIRLVAVVACAAIAISGAPPAIRAIGSIPLIFVFPGYALARDILPPSADLVTRTAWTLGLSLTVSVLLPILVGIPGIHLSLPVWVVGLVTVTLAGELGARLRHSAPPLPLSRPRAPISAASAAVLATAATITIVGLIVSYVDADRRAVTTATQLWMVPGTAGDLRIGVMPYATGGAPLRLVIDDGTTQREFPITLSGPAFETTWPLTSQSAVVRASLYAGDSSIPIREVFNRNGP